MNNELCYIKIQSIRLRLFFYNFLSISFFTTSNELSSNSLIKDNTAHKIFSFLSIYLLLLLFKKLLLLF